MKIEKVIIENINSIENAEIDFAEGVLASEPLFLVTGDTGSGKSTILDAITLALYDKSPRYENTKNKEKTENGETTMQSTTNALRKGTTDGKAEVWFKVGGETYIATWQMHKTRGGRYETNNRRKLEVLKGGERLVIETKVDVLKDQMPGLIGLTYDQFIRSVMLAQGQFNTFLTSEKSKQTEILEMLTGTEIYSKIADIVGRRKNDAKTLEVNAFKFYDSLQNKVLLDDDIASLNENLAKNQTLLVKNEKEIKDLEGVIRNLDNLDKINDEIELSKSQLADLQASYDKMLEEKEVLEKRRDELKKRIDEQSGVKSLAEKMPLIMSLLENSDISDVMPDLEKTDFSEISRSLSEAEKVQKNAIAAYDECDERLKKADYDGLVAKQHEHNNELAKHEARKTRCLRVKQILNDYLDKKQIIENKTVDINKLKEYFNICEDAYQSAKKTFDAKDSDFQVKKNMVEEHIKSLRSKLVEGEPCPLCGSTTHQYHDEAVVSSLFNSIEKSWNEARDAFEKSKDERNKTEQKIKLLNESIASEQRLLENLVNNLNKECNGEPVYEMDRLDKGLAACELKIKEENAEICSINEQIQAARKIQDELKELKKKKDEAEASYNALLKKLAYKWKKLNNEYSKVDSDIVKIDEIVNGIRRIDGIERVDEFKGKVASRDDINKNSLLIGFSKVVFNLIDKSEQKKVIENQFVGGKNPVKSDVLDSLKQLEEQKKQLESSLTDIRASLSLNAQNSASAQAAKDDWQAKKVQLSLWTQLASAIGTTSTDNFRDVAQAYTMRILLDQANYFLHKLSTRYELTCYTNSLAIMVADNEMGGELRTASSLSGGETFLVSLALALGLASLNDENLNIDMLFIDEGFGTLDGESLEMAVQTLGNMQKFGKKVGIISHVDSLKERIPAQIRVTKRGKAASTVTIVKS